MAALIVLLIELQDVEQFVRQTAVSKNTSSGTTEVTGDSNRKNNNDDTNNVTNLSGSSQPPGESSDLSISPQLVVSTTSTTGPTHTPTDVRRGAMWRDSLFPSDFRQPETTSMSAAAAETLGGRSAAVGKPAGKPDERSDRKGAGMGMSGTARLDWETLEHRNIDTLSTATSSSSQSYSHTFPHSTPPPPVVSNPLQAAYHYNKPLVELSAGSGGFRYDSGASSSGRRSVHDAYSRGPTYDVAAANSAVVPPQPQRSASVRPPPLAGGVEAAHRLPPGGPPGVDAHRLSHMWPGTPLPAHQHHVSLSHLQHLVNPEEFQYGAPSAEFARPCQQPTRHHGGGSSHHGTSSAHHSGGSSSRQQHKAHAHKPSATSSVTNQSVPPSALSAAPYADMFSACRGIQQPPIGYFPHQGAAAALPMGLHHAQMAQMAVAAAANFAGQPMPAGQAANSAMYSAAAAAAYSYLNGGGLQPFNVDINSVMRR